MKTQQQGIAIILFMLLLPVVAGLMTLAVEGGKRLRDSARLGNAAEVAVLAISARPSDTPEKNDQLAKDFILAMMKETKNLRVNLDTIPCTENSDCDETESSKKFTEYQLKVSGKYANWLGGKQSLGFDQSIPLGNKSIARKNHGQAIDVFFVADFSSSMGGSWTGVIKIDMLKDILKKISYKLEDFTRIETNPDKKNTISLIPFALHTFERDPATGIADSVSNINFFQVEDSVNNMFVEKEPRFFLEHGKFYTIHPTTQAKKIEDELSKIEPYGGTASYEGIIRAAQLARKTKNAKRLIIVLTDGVDSDSVLNNKLTDLNYCKIITDKIEEGRTPSGERVHAEIAVISFSYDVTSNKALTSCVGKDKVFSAQDPDAIYSIMSSLIAEEIGHIFAR
ncbi:VWA domain-containing protein [Parendozoicomonas sp. Alg238-R29]|uniref:TadE/TadG family type IV pilus assembly protein n=1 Tax=Parendozoicomonas sp. Alg238-R29 TaxID=2993446 RepID=UPI00248D7701|nr:VWA domain-containing protein [Parendozoicomonas sp. Alg238-R29]